jgi:hypothetical protein
MKCLVMAGPIRDAEWMPKPLGLVSAAFHVADEYDGILNFDIQAGLQKKAEKIGANLVTDVTLTSAPLGGDSDCYMVAIGNAYYVPELEPGHVPESASSE